MIQRIQTVYLLIVLLMNAVLVQWTPLWTNSSGQKIFLEGNIWVSVIFYAIAAFALLSIFMFKNRKQQFVMNRLNIILNLFLLGLFVYRSLNLSGETTISEKGIGMMIPVFSIVFLVLANRAIKKDHDLVKSVDRLR